MALVLLAESAAFAQVTEIRDAPVKIVLDGKDARIRGFVDSLEKRGVKLVYEESTNILRWRIVEPKVEGGTLQIGICSFTPATEAEKRGPFTDFSWGWQHVNAPAQLAMTRIWAEGFDKGKPEEIVAFEEKLRVAFFWHQRKRPLKNGLTNEIVDAGLDPKDERIAALVAYLGRNGIKLTLDKETSQWRIVEPRHTDGILSVSIRSFPPPASEEQMRDALDINLYYELNVEAQIAMSDIITWDSKERKLPDGLQTKLQRLFHEYQPAGAKWSEQAAKASSYLLAFLKARDIDLRPAPNSTNVVQRMYSIGPDHDRRFYVGLNYLPPMTVDAFRKAHKGNAFPYELGGHFALFKVGGPNGNSTKEYHAAWKKVSAAFEEYANSSAAHSAERYFAYWLTRHPPAPKSHEYEPVLLIARLPIEKLGRLHERAGDMGHSGALQEKIKSGKPNFTPQLLDEFALTMETHHKDSIWNPDGRPIKRLQSIGKVDWKTREATVNGKKYLYEEAALADVVRLLERPEGKEPIHRLFGAVSGFEQTAKALRLLLQDQIAADKEAANASLDGWKKSADGILAMHFSVVPTQAKPGQPIEVTVKVRNVSAKPITIVRPFPWGPEYPTFRIRDSKGFLGFHGMPPPSVDESWWRVGAALAQLAPGAEFKESAKLDWSNYPDLRTPGTYRFVFDYSYRRTWDGLEERAKVKLWKGKVEELTATVEVQAAQQPKQKQKGDAKAAIEWAKSKDGVVGIHLRAKSTPINSDDAFVLVGLVRNFSHKPIHVVKPFNGPFVGVPIGLEVVGPKSKVKYVGPELQPRAFADGDLIYLEPGQILEDDIALDAPTFTGAGDPGEYAIRFKYSTLDIVDRKLRDKSWSGAIETTAKTKRIDQASAAPKAGTQFTVTKTSIRFDPKTCVRGSAGLGWGLGSVGVNVLGREDGYCVFDYTDEVEGGYSIYRCRVDLDGPPVTIESTPSGIKTSFSLKDAHVLHRGNIHFEFRVAKDGPTWRQRGVPKTSFVNHYADLATGDGATADTDSRVKIRYTVYTDRRFTTPLAGAMSKTLEFQLGAKDIDAGLQEAARGMKVGGKRVILIREEVIPTLATTLGGIQAGTQVPIRVELLDAK